MPRPRLKQKQILGKEAPRPADATREHQRERDLLKLLGYEPATTFLEEFWQQNSLRDVWILCGKYRLDFVIDHLPTPAYFRDQFDAMIKEIDKLLARLGAMDEATRELLTAWLATRSSVRLSDIESNLAFLRDAARDAIASENGTKSQGRPVDSAFKDLIDKLRAEFAREYRGSSSTKRPPKSGFIQKLSPREKEERAFVKLALEAEGIRPPSDLNRLFRDADARRESTKVREAAPKKLRSASGAHRCKKGT